MKNLWQYGFEMNFKKKVLYKIMGYCKDKIILNRIYHYFLSSHASKLLEDWKETEPPTEMSIEQRIHSLENAIRILQDVGDKFDFKLLTEEDLKEELKEGETLFTKWYKKQFAKNIEEHNKNVNLRD